MGPETEYALIALTKGQVAMIDLLDCGRVSKHKWTYVESGYAMRRHGGRKNGKTMYLHRFVNETPSSKSTDHADQRKWNNCRRNLRDCDSSQNKANVGKVRSNTSSKFKGVSWSQSTQKWTVFVGGKYVGRSDSEVNAALMYNAGAIEKYGEFSILNEVG